MLVLIGGGTGFVGSAVRRLLLRKGHNVLSISRTAGKDKITWDQINNEGLPECDAVVNLAGENILNPMKRWTTEFKQAIVDSRVKTTADLASAIGKATKPPQVYVATSAVGYYATSLTAEYTEDSVSGDSYSLARMCTDWEAAAQLPETHSHVKTVIVRTGVVLGRQGGAIQQLIWPFWLGLGGVIGSGRQYFPWIHIDDMAGIFVHAVENSDTVPTILNGVGPTPATNREFTKAFASALWPWRPAIIPTPEFVIRMVFGEERAVMLLEGQRVIPKKVIESGFVYEYPTVEEAMKEIVG